MGRRVEDCRIGKVRILEADYNELHWEARRRVEMYWGKAQVSNGVLSFELPVYRWEEIRTFLPQDLKSRLWKEHDDG